MVMSFNESPEKMFLYHYVEELISDYGLYYNNINTQNLTIKEYSVLLRIRFTPISTQNDLVKLFKVSGAYMAKLLKKFEDENYIFRIENPQNRREKIVKLTDDGIKKTDYLISLIEDWESEVTSNLTEEEITTLKILLSKIVWR